jgi:tetratricopeptide (TPR) repeat protein
MDEAISRLHAKIFSLLNTGSPECVREAGRLCATLPEPVPPTQSHIDHALISTAWALEQAGEIEPAIALYSRLMKCEEAGPEARANATYRYALMRGAQGRSMESIAAFELAIRIAPLPPIARFAKQQLVNLFFNDGRFQEAIPHLDHLIAGPDTEEADRFLHQLQRQRALLKTGQCDPDQRNWPSILPGAGLPIEERFIGPWSDVAIELEVALQHELAGSFYLRLLEMQGVPSRIRTNCHFRLGLIREALADWDESFRHYQAAVDAPPEFPEAQVKARLSLAILHYLSEDYEAAASHLAALPFAGELPPHQRLEAHFRLGVCLLRLGKLEEAQRELEAYRERCGGADVKTDLCLAELFELRGELASAKACYQRAMTNPNAEPVTKAAALTRFYQLR